MTTEKKTTLAQDRAEVQQAYADWRETLRRRQVVGTMCHEYAAPDSRSAASEAEARWRSLSDAYEARRRLEMTEADKAALRT